LEDSGLENERKRFIEDFGLMFERGGVPRMTGRVLGWLLISNPPHQSAQELAEALQASKGSISSATRMLIQIGFVERMSLPGDRKTYYVIKAGVWSQLARRRMQHFTVQKDLAARGLSLLKDDEPAIRLRLQAMYDIHAFFEREYCAVLDRWDQERG